MQKLWSQVPRSSKCVSEGELETRRVARASVKVEKKKKKEAAAKCLGSGGFREGPPGWDLHNEELSPRMGHARAHGNRHDSDRRILAEYRVSSLVTVGARARLEPQIPGLLPCCAQNQTDGETALACHQAPWNLCCHSPLTALLGPGA